MLYRILKWLFYPTVKGYFRSLHVEGRSNIPESGPLIFVANHNSAFMDPIVLAVHIRQSVYFLARGEAFKSKLASWIFGFLNMIPVYRPEISPDEMHKNKMVFKRCFDHLKKEKTILIFPEGYSETVRTLRQLKTGTARIALGAEDYNDFNLNLQIVPIGINYSDPHSFRSDVYVNFGSPIEVGQYESNYLDNEKDAVLKLTNEIEERLEELLLIVEDEKLGKLITQVDTLMRNEKGLKQNTGGRERESFSLSKRITIAMASLKEKHPQRLIDFRRKIKDYFKDLGRLGIKDAQIRRPGKRPNLLVAVLYMILGAPVFIYGFLVNVLPFFTVRLMSANIRVREDFVGSLKLALGAFIFLIFYVVEMIVFASFFNWYWAILFVMSLYPAGLFTINFIKNYYKFRSSLRFTRLLRKGNDLLTDLQMRRERLIADLEKSNELYSLDVNDHHHRN